MNPAILTPSYLIAHLAAGALCIGIIVVVPFVAMLIVAIVGNDAGGPLFFPIFLLLLAAAGAAVAATLSLATVLSDIARTRWRVQLWLPPLVVFCVISIPVSFSGRVFASILLGLGAAVAFSLYWLAVSSVWFLPRLLARLIHSRAQRFPPFLSPRWKNGDL